MLREKEFWDFPVPVGRFVVFRHGAPFVGDEPHQFPSVVEAIEPSRKGFDVRIRTDSGKLFVVKGVNEGNFTLAFEP